MFDDYYRCTASNHHQSPYHVGDVGPLHILGFKFEEDAKQFICAHKHLPYCKVVKHVQRKIMTNLGSENWIGEYTTIFEKDECSTECECYRCRNQPDPCLFCDDWNKRRLSEQSTKNQNN